MFGQGFTCPALLASLETPFPYGTVTLCGGPFQKPSGRRFESTGLVPGRSSLLGESRLLSFPPATEIFQFAGFASCAYGFGARYHAIVVGFPIRTSGAQRPLTPRPGLSQCATSFIASRRQGIHQMPFVHSPAPARNPPRRAPTPNLGENAPHGSAPEASSIPPNVAHERRPVRRAHDPTDPDDARVMSRTLFTMSNLPLARPVRRRRPETRAFPAARPIKRATATIAPRSGGPKPGPRSGGPKPGPSAASVGNGGGPGPI